MTKDRVSALCRALDVQVEAFRSRPLEGAYPYLWLDAKQLKVRDQGHVRSKALVVACAMHQPCRPAQRSLVSAALREVFNTDSPEQARERVSELIERLAPVVPKVCSLLEEAEEDLLAFYRFPPAHWSKLRSTNPLERVNREIGRRSDVVGIFPNDASVTRLAGALLIEQNDEWLVGRRHLSAESPPLVLRGERDKNKEEGIDLTAARAAAEDEEAGVHHPRRPYR